MLNENNWDTFVSISDKEEIVQAMTYRNTLECIDIIKQKERGLKMKWTSWIDEMKNVRANEIAKIIRLSDTVIVKDIMAKFDKNTPTVAGFIRNNMRRFGLTTADLATKCNVETEVIDGILSGKVRMYKSLSQALSHIFKIDALYLLGLSRYRKDQV